MHKLLYLTLANYELFLQIIIELERTILMYIFNSEHDLSLANNDQSFMAPASAAGFSRDCGSIMRFLPQDSPIIVWGWDKAVRHRLLLDGVDPRLLPSDEQLKTIRELSHRRLAIECTKHILSSYPSPLWCLTSAKEAFCMDEIRRIVEDYNDTILKSPWSGSGRGLRPVRKDSWTESDIGWCEKTIEKQGSVIVERREKVAVDFSVQYIVERNIVRFAGYSIFRTFHGAYTANLLASNEDMLSYLGTFTEKELILKTRDLVQSFLENEFCGKYLGTIGVDMFIDKTHCLVPCVELNVRNNMGLVARNLFDHHFDTSLSAKYEMSVLYSPDNDTLKSMISQSAKLLTDFNDQCHYAIVCRPQQFF